MTTQTLDRMNAAQGAKRLTYIPTNLEPRALLDVLHRLGLAIPTKLAAAASAGDLRASGHRFTIKEIDAALSQANVMLSDRFRVKTAMGRNGILER